jgi:hypothetical protein
MARSFNDKTGRKAGQARPVGRTVTVSGTSTGVFRRDAGASRPTGRAVTVAGTSTGVYRRDAERPNARRSAKKR